MGRARDLAATAAGGTLIPRISALETHSGVVDAQLITLDSDIDAAVAAASAASTAAAAAQTTANGVASRPTILNNFVDNFTNVPIGQPLQSFWRSLHHIDLANVKAGDKYLIISQGQVRSDWDFNVEQAPWLTWTPSYSALAHDSTGHNSLSFYIAGNNVRQTVQHYFAWNRHASITFGSNYSQVRLHNNLRCRSSDPNIDGSGNQAMIVNAGQGGITAIKLN